MSERVASPTDLWFELADGQTSRLYVAFAPGQGPKTPDFEATIDGTPPIRAVFVFLAFLKGRTIFAAREWHPADAPAPAEPDRLWRLSGPLRKGPQDVA